MILPTIICISVDSLQAIPPTYREGSIALGATKWQTVQDGPIAGGPVGHHRQHHPWHGPGHRRDDGRHHDRRQRARAVPGSILDPVRTLTSNIALEMGYAAGDHRQALFATGVILFVIIMILNTVANVTASRMRGTRDEARPRAGQAIARTVLWTLTIITVVILVYIIVFILRKGCPP